MMKLLDDPTLSAVKLEKSIPTLAMLAKLFFLNINIYLFSQEFVQDQSGFSMYTEESILRCQASQTQL
jgi:hypothetical protein